MPYVRCPDCDLLTYCVRGERCPTCDAELLPNASRLPGREPLARNVEQTMELAVRQLGMEASALGEVTGGMEVVRRVGGAAESLGIRAGMRSPLADTYCQQLLEGGLPNAVPDTRRQPEVADLPGTVEVGIRSYVGVQFSLNARLYVLCCLSRERQPELGELEVSFLRGIAESVRAQLDG